ncbi:extracellular solute-binding protein [Actinoallomurus purpureus]|uniref:extracellular solute-binding protein n=1 Tax=Actinoallomurus purpureus TaxID=478114 RepID=UPI002093BF45|nr:extracellular solute-binding protein [Actinoallomurus purpureus]MCO6008653.1 extracellular solute-binding protein [Actinoallomurus purpureus]
MTTVMVAAALSACGGSSSDGKTIKVAYQKFGNFIGADELFKKIKPVFEQQNPGYKLKLIPIEADENSYYTKLNLMRRSPNTAPDVAYEDTFFVNSDAQARFLMPLDDNLKSWPDWSQFVDNAKVAGQAADGHTYGIPMGTDTRGLWYNKQIFAKAGLPANWQPKTWNDVLAAARQIKAKVPGVIPLNVYAGKGVGEAASMQGFEMLLYGTGDKLYDDQTKKWVAPSKGMGDSFNFLKTVYSSGLGPTPQQTLDPHWSDNVAGQELPKGKLAIDLDGSWLPQAWIPGGASAWPQWSSTLGTAPMPTQNGQAPGKVTMSGGWLLSLGARTKNASAAWKLVQLAMNKENSLFFYVKATQVSVRKDVVDDPKYVEGNPTQKFWTDLVSVTQYRPAYSVYPQISNQLQAATEAVVTGQGSPQSAMNDLAGQIKQIAGPDKVEGKS